jgi:hypothetical protein
MPNEETPANYDDFADEIRVENGKPPRWLTKAPYVAMTCALGYYAWVRATDPVNLVFAALFALWFVYTPIAQKKGWFFLPM